MITHNELEQTGKGIKDENGKIGNAFKRTNQLVVDHTSNIALARGLTQLCIRDGGSDRGGPSQHQEQSAAIEGLPRVEMRAEEPEQHRETWVTHSARDAPSEMRAGVDLRPCCAIIPNL